MNGTIRHDQSIQNTVLIIGGGLAGLSLAQGLKQQQIPFRIFERDTSASFRTQGYRIRISSDGAQALRQLLPTPLFDAFEATSADIVHGGHAVDAATGGVMDWRGPGGGPRGPHGSGKVYNADRVVLRSLLLSGLEEKVEFGKRLDRYEVVGDCVEAYFTDGTSVNGALLIGADGVRSVVRRQFLPGLNVLDTEGRAVFGKTVVTDTLRQQLPKQIGSGLTIAFEQGETRMKLFTDGMCFDRGRSAVFESSLDLEIPKDYIYWVLVFRKDVVQEDADALPHFTSEQSVELSQKLTATWHESLRVLINDQVPEAASTLTFLTSTPGFGHDWARKTADTAGRVTLIGDAAHPMPPVGGLGANAGFQDALGLFDQLQQNDGNAGWEQLVSEYERTMLERAKPIVETSSGGAGRFFGMKPLNDLKPAVLWQ